jgi:hypothetical protein
LLLRRQYGLNDVPRDFRAIFLQGYFFLVTPTPLPATGTPVNYDRPHTKRLASRYVPAWPFSRSAEINGVGCLLITAGLHLPPWLFTAGRWMLPWFRSCLVALFKGDALYCYGYRLGDVPRDFWAGIFLSRYFCAPSPLFGCLSITIGNWSAYSPGHRISLMAEVAVWGFHLLSWLNFPSYIWRTYRPPADHNKYVLLVGGDGSAGPISTWIEGS